ncbi:MAG: DNA repair exonuclease [Nanoarchaeota archaeon]|nr:DNA repair exonuclease [Nanoarchaeota archaeon]MBU0962313.1 DNA repair exonuclease [Nanoarchaeota archaeon]
MKFIHIADCHLGGWREPKLQELGIKSFKKVIDCCINEYIGFLLISGDLFDTALPNIELLKETASELSRLKENDIPVYIIAGSHDFSPSGKTMLDVLEKAGLIENVTKLKDNKLEFTTDRTGTKITGLLGKKGSLDKEYYELLDKNNLESEKGFKIFMFHTTLNEFKPKELEHIEGQSLALLPKHFDYYAGGHVHFIFEKDIENYGKIVYPGPLFPNNFLELEKLKNGGFYSVEYKDKKLSAKYVPVELVKVDSYYFDANNKIPLELEKEIKLKIKDTKDKIILVRIEGILKEGKPSDINFKELLSFKDSYIILKNTSKLTTKEQEEIEIKEGSIEEIESSLIKELKFDNELITKIMTALDIEKNEGEKTFDFEERIIKDMKKVMEI